MEIMEARGEIKQILDELRKEKSEKLQEGHIQDLQN